MRSNSASSIVITPSCAMHAPQAFEHLLLDGARGAVERVECRVDRRVAAGVGRQGARASSSARRRDGLREYAAAAFSGLPGLPAWARADRTTATDLRRRLDCFNRTRVGGRGAKNRTRCFKIIRCRAYSNRLTLRSARINWVTARRNCSNCGGVS